MFSYSIKDLCTLFIAYLSAEVLVTCIYTCVKNPNEFYLVSCNAQRYEIVNGITEVELASEDTKVEEGEEKTPEGKLRNTMSSLCFSKHVRKYHDNFTCFFSEKGVPSFWLTALKNNDVTSEEVSIYSFGIHFIWTRNDHSLTFFISGHRA